MSVVAVYKIYIGSRDIVNLGKPGFGILETNLNDLSSFNEIHPEGPLMNRVFSIETRNGNLWCTFGGYSGSYNFNGGLPFTGRSHYVNEKWINKPYDSIAAVVNNPRHLSNMAINPFNPDQVYVGSYYSGLIDVQNDEIIELYNENNSTIVPFAADLCLTLPSNFGATGSLWATN